MKNLPKEEMEALAQRAKQLRLYHTLTQEGLARRSGVSLGSLKRFEHTGKISIESLLKLAFVLDAMDGFGALFARRDDHESRSLDALIKSSKRRKRGVKS